MVLKYLYRGSGKTKKDGFAYSRNKRVQPRALPNIIETSFQCIIDGWLIFNYTNEILASISILLT